MFPETISRTKGEFKAFYKKLPAFDVKHTRMLEQ